MLPTKSQIKIIKSILGKYLTSFEVYVFGSRSKNKSRKSSDLDLLIKTEKEIELSKIGFIKEELEQSDLPFKVDLVDYSKSKKEFLDKITPDLRPL